MFYNRGRPRILLEFSTDAIRLRAGGIALNAPSTCLDQPHWQAAGYNSTYHPGRSSSVDSSEEVCVLVFFHGRHPLWVFTYGSNHNVIADWNTTDVISCLGGLFMLGLIFLEFIQTRLLLRKIETSGLKFGTLQQRPSSIHDRWLVVRVTIPMVFIR